MSLILRVEIAVVALAVATLLPGGLEAWGTPLALILLAAFILVPHVGELIIERSRRRQIALLETAPDGSVVEIDDERFEKRLGYWSDGMFAFSSDELFEIAVDEEMLLEVRIPSGEGEQVADGA